MLVPAQEAVEGPGERVRCLAARLRLARLVQVQVQARAGRLVSLMDILSIISTCSISREVA